MKPLRVVTSVFRRGSGFSDTEAKPDKYKLSITDPPCNAVPCMKVNVMHCACRARAVADVSLRYEMQCIAQEAVPGAPLRA